MVLVLFAHVLPVQVVALLLLVGSQCLVHLLLHGGNLLLDFLEVVVERLLLPHGLLEPAVVCRLGLLEDIIVVVLHTSDLLRKDEPLFGLAAVDLVFEYLQVLLACVGFTDLLVN